MRSIVALVVLARAAGPAPARRIRRAADAADVNGHGRFRGGFYRDAEINGPGCACVTTAHELTSHDDSPRCRCCATR